MEGWVCKKRTKNLVWLLHSSEGLRDSLRFLGKFQGTFGAKVVELQIKSTMAYGIFEYLYIIYANSL